jgi:uncharacterized protein with ACT and thioredoxin-like domain
MPSSRHDLRKRIIIMLRAQVGQVALGAIAEADRTTSAVSAFQPTQSACR